MKSRKTYRVHMMYGADGRLQTSYFEGEAAKVAKKNVKAFNKELRQYEKSFIEYASLDIDSANISNLNRKQIFNKLGIAEKYVDYIPAGDMAESLGDEMVAIAGNKKATSLGISAKIASKFQPFFERQAEKHPSMQKLADRVTKAANDGRMPLTADSAAMMRIAFDKKYYNDCRRLGANRELLDKQYEHAVQNLAKMADYDGVSPQELSDAFSAKLLSQMQLDESLTDIYEGMATGKIRLADSDSVKDAKGNNPRVNGRSLHVCSSAFVENQIDKNGDIKQVRLDAWEFKPRQPKSVEEHLADYQQALDTYAKSCQTEGQFKKMLASDSYKYIERNVKAFAEADCPDDAEKFKYEFARTNLRSCQKWGVANNKSAYARLNIPEPYDKRFANDPFRNKYATDDYYSIDDMTEKSDKAAKDVVSMTDEALANEMIQECKADIDTLENTVKTEKLEREVQESQELLEKSRNGELTESTLQVADHEDVYNKPSTIAKVINSANLATNATALLQSIKRGVQERYGSNEPILHTDSKSSVIRLKDEKPKSLTMSNDAGNQFDNQSDLSFSTAEPSIDEKPVKAADAEIETVEKPTESIVFENESANLSEKSVDESKAKSDVVDDDLTDYFMLYDRMYVLSEENEEFRKSILTISNGVPKSMQYDKQIWSEIMESEELCDMICQDEELWNQMLKETKPSEHSSEELQEQISAPQRRHSERYDEIWEEICGDDELWEMVMNKDTSFDDDKQLTYDELKEQVDALEKKNAEFRGILDEFKEADAILEKEYEPMQETIEQNRDKLVESKESSFPNLIARFSSADGMGSGQVDDTDYDISY